MHVSARAHAFHIQARPLQPTKDRRPPDDADTGRVREVRRRPEEDRRRGNSRQRPAEERPEATEPPMAVPTPAPVRDPMTSWSSTASVDPTALWTLLGTLQSDGRPVSAIPPAADAGVQDSSLQDLLALVSKT